MMRASNLAFGRRERLWAVLFVLTLGCACTAPDGSSGGGSAGPSLQPLGRFDGPPESAATQPVRLALGDDGRIFVTDAVAQRVVVLRDGTPEFALVDLDRPLGIAVRGDRLLVGNAGRGSVDVYGLGERRYLFSLGRGAGEFKMPNDLALAPDGTVYVADSQADRILIYGPDGEARGGFGGTGVEPGQLRFPVALAVATDSEEVFVGDQGNHRVQVFDRDGTFLRTFGSGLPVNATSAADVAGRFTRIQAIALSPGRVHVLDTYHAHVQTLDRRGHGLGITGRRGACEDCLGLALALAAAGPDRLLVTDPDHRRLVTLTALPEVTP